MLGPPGNLRFDAGLFEQFGDGIDDVLYLGLARFAPDGQLLGDFLVFFRVGIAETQVFEFPLDLPDAQAVGQRGEDVEGLLGDPAALCIREGAQGAHVMQPVGQLDKDHPHIAVHCQECFAQGFDRKFPLAVAQGGYRVSTCCSCSFAVFAA